MFDHDGEKHHGRVSFATVGCRLNQAEADCTRDEFSSRGWEVVDFGQAADVVMINSCTVTGRADRSSRQLIHRARRTTPDAIVIAAGCFAASHAQDLVEEGEVDLVLGVTEKSRPFDYLPRNGRPERPEIYVDTESSELRVSVGTRVTGRSRAFLKVQDGCDHACAYCAVTIVRGPSRSAPFEDVRAALVRIKNAGFEEVVLTGVDLSAWGHDLKNSRLDFVDLVRLAADTGLPRVRVSSLEPWELSPQRVRGLASIPQWCEHFHVSLQSADPDLLAAMNRPTDLGLLRETIAELLALRPRASVGADIITGFPGETEEAFERTLRFLDDGPLHYLHVFPYSLRPGTPAATLENTVDHDTIHRRARTLREASRTSRRARMLEMVGSRDEVLVEDDGRSGYTRGYFRAQLMTGNHPPKSRVLVTLDELDGNNDILYARTAS